MYLSKQRADQVSGGIFLIGLGLLFANVLPWWPGIMFVLGASAIARGFAEGQGWYALQGGIWLIGIGLIFTSGFSWPLLLIILGLSTLFGAWFRPPFARRRGFDETEKVKNDERMAAGIEADDEEYTLGDDGELVKVKNDEKLSQTGSGRA